MDQPHMDLTDSPPNTPTPPPSYSPSIASTPSYTAEPSSDEESLELAIRPRTPIPRGKFTVKAGDIMVTLHEQEFGAGIPTYRQNAVIKGDVEITSNSNQRIGTVISVAIILVGRQILEISGVGSHERLLFSETHDLWTRTPSLPLSQESPTPPPTIRSKFHVPFPTKFVDKSYAHPLVVPPTFEVKSLDERAFSARNEYTLSVVVKTERVASRTTKYDSTTLPILLNYRPRSRPYLPIATPLLPFFRTIKSAPEEWFQVSSLVPSKNGERELLDCHLFIPRAQIYALADTIPFHVQLRGSLESIQKFSSLNPESTHTGTPALPPNRPSKSIPSSSPRSPSPFEPVYPQITTNHTSTSQQVRVYLLRQISVQVKGIRASKDLILGEGKLRSIANLPPWYDSESTTREREDDLDYSLDWEGEVRCDEDVLIPSFISGELHVKDSIVVHLRPVDSKVADHLDHRFTHTIRFVTDKYRDVHPSDESPLL